MRPEACLLAIDLAPMHAQELVLHASRRLRYGTSHHLLYVHVSDAPAARAADSGMAPPAISPMCMHPTLLHASRRPRLLSAYTRA